MPYLQQMTLVKIWSAKVSGPCGGVGFCMTPMYTDIVVSSYSNLYNDGWFCLNQAQWYYFFNCCEIKFTSPHLVLIVSELSFFIKIANIACSNCVGISFFNDYKWGVPYVNFATSAYWRFCLMHKLSKSFFVHGMVVYILCDR